MEDDNTIVFEHRVNVTMTCLRAVEAEQARIDKEQQGEDAFLGGMVRPPRCLTETEKRGIVAGILRGKVVRLAEGT